MSLSPEQLARGKALIELQARIHQASTILHPGAPAHTGWPAASAASLEMSRSTHRFSLSHLVGTMARRANAERCFSDQICFGGASY